MASTSAWVSGSRSQASMSKTSPATPSQVGEVPWVEESSRMGLPARGAR